MNKQLKLCDFELSKSLKELGFDWLGKLRIDNYYNYKGEFKGDCIEMLKHRKDISDKYDIILAPNLELTKQYFREVHKLHVNSDIDSEGTWFYDVQLITSTGYEYKSISGEYTTFDTYELALAAGLIETCKLIKDGK